MFQRPDVKPRITRLLHQLHTQPLKLQLQPQQHLPPPQLLGYPAALLHIRSKLVTVAIPLVSLTTYQRLTFCTKMASKVTAPTFPPREKSCVFRISARYTRCKKMTLAIKSHKRARMHSPSRSWSLGIQTLTEIAQTLVKWSECKYASLSPANQEVHPSRPRPQKLHLCHRIRLSAQILTALVTTTYRQGTIVRTSQFRRTSHC